MPLQDDIKRRMSDSYLQEALQLLSPSWLGFPGCADGSATCQEMTHLFLQLNLRAIPKPSLWNHVLQIGSVKGQ